MAHATVGPPDFDQMLAVKLSGRHTRTLACVVDTARICC
jgi:hypothetical protein